MKAEWKIALVSPAGYQGAPVWPTAIVGAKLLTVSEIDKKPGAKSQEKMAVSRPMSLARALVAALLLMPVMGCSTLGYYQQAVSGQLQLIVNRRDLDAVLSDPEVRPVVKQKILLARRVSQFAERELGLPVEDTFSTYVDVGSPYVVWSVFAASEFSLDLKKFCYPIAGCVSYKGYFSPNSAAQFSQSLAAQGLDVFYGGVAAYSTLGWFADPLLNTFIERDDTRLAGLLFHELAHKIIYIPGDSRFNESFATAIERAALLRWLQLQQQGDAFEDYLVLEQQRSQVLALIKSAKVELTAIYASTATDAVKRQGKAQVFEAMRARYKALVTTGQVGRVFSEWMASEINNAGIGALADYNDWVASFEVWLANLDGNLPAFYREVQQLATLDRKERDAFLNQLAATRTAE